MPSPILGKGYKTREQSQKQGRRYNRIDDTSGIESANL
jgi:hypothetical protein